jgi:hypothetical protein
MASSGVSGPGINDHSAERLSENRTVEPRHVIETRR